jgi:hypothetical protein
MPRHASDLPSIHAGDDSHRAYVSPSHAPKLNRATRTALPHACTFCGARFRDESGVQKHQKTCRYRPSTSFSAHAPARSAAVTGKPSRCPRCGKTFKTRGARNQHLTDKKHWPRTKAAKQGTRPLRRRVTDKATRAARQRPARREVPATNTPAREAPRRTELHDGEVAVRSALGPNGAIVVSWPRISGARRARIDVLDADGLRVRRARVETELGEIRIGKLTQFRQPLTVEVTITGSGSPLTSGRATIDVGT